MKILAFVLLSGLSALIPLYGADVAKPHSVNPKDGFVPDEQTAVAIAVAVWIPIYGKGNIDGQKPYTATLVDGIWHIVGSLPKKMRGGVAIAEIQKSDAKVLRVSHGR